MYNVKSEQYIIGILYAYFGIVVVHYNPVLCKQRINYKEIDKTGGF